MLAQSDLGPYVEVVANWCARCSYYFIEEFDSYTGLPIKRNYDR